MISASKALHRYGLVGLLALGALLQGAKTPLQFAAWGSALVIWAASVWLGSNRTVRPRALGLEVTLAAFLVLAQIRSLDASASLFWTAQWLVWLLVWCTLKIHPQTVDDADALWLVCAGLGVLGSILTLRKWMTGSWGFAYGFLPVNPGFNGAWMAALSLGLAVHLQGSWRRLPRTIRFFEAAVALLLAGLTVGGPSRSTLVAFGLGLLLAAAPWITLRRVAVVLGFVTAGLALTPSRIIYDHLRANDGNYRFKIWAIAGRATAERPLSGYGPGNFEMAYQRYAFPVETDLIRFARSTQFAHNEYLQVAAEAGLPAFLLFVAGVLFVLRRYPRDPRARPAYVAFVTLAAGSLNNILWHMPFLVFLTLLWAAQVLHASAEPGRLPEAERRARAGGPGRAAMAGLVLLEAVVLWSGLRLLWGGRGHWDWVVRVNPGDAVAWHEVALRQTDARHASAADERAIRLSPRQVYFRESLAQALESTGDPGDGPMAMLQYQTALELAPGRAINALALGRCYLRAGEPALAEASFENARRIEPRYWQADLWLARAQWSQGRRREAIRLLEQLPRRRQQYQDWRARVQVDLQTPNEPGEYDQMILSYDPGTIRQQLAEWRLNK